MVYPGNGAPSFVLLTDMTGRRCGLADDGTCASLQSACTRRRLDGYQFCWRHILEDKSSPYRQCSLASAETGRRCPNAALKFERKEPLCSEHQAQAVRACWKDSARKQSQTAASLLDSLERYRPACSRSASGGGDATAKLGPQQIKAASVDATGWSSSDDSCCEELPSSLTWKGDPNSDDDSIDSEGDDPFKYTDVFTEEEAVRKTREKLIRLQSLYVEQFKHLQQVLADSRVRYATAAKQESSQGVSASPQYFSTTGDATGSAAAAASVRSDTLAREQRRAAIRYRRKFGIEALMHQRLKHRLAASARGETLREAELPPAMQRCSAGAGRAGRCNSRVVPLSKFCLRHISNDPHQVLFKRCSFLGGGCERPVAAIFRRARCDLHEGFRSRVAVVQQAKPADRWHGQPVPQPLAVGSENGEVTAGDASMAAALVSDEVVFQKDADRDNEH